MRDCCRDAADAGEAMAAGCRVVKGSALPRAGGGGGRVGAPMPTFAGVREAAKRVAAGCGCPGLSS